MDGKNLNIITDSLFTFAKETMEKYRVYPYVSFVLKNGVIIARGCNIERETRDITMMGDVVAIRGAQESLESGDLSGYSLFSFFEPTILGFDVALWSGIKEFYWCINSASLPNHYNKLKYNPLDYLKNHPGEITITNGIREKEALELAMQSKSKNYYPDNLLN